MTIDAVFQRHQLPGRPAVLVDRSAYPWIVVPSRIRTMPTPLATTWWGWPSSRSPAGSTGTNSAGPSSLVEWSSGRVVDTDLVAVDEVAAEEGAGHGQAIAESAAQPGTPGRGTQPESGSVEDAVHQARPPDLVVGVLPVGEPGHRGRGTARDPDTHREPGRLTETGWSRRQRIDGIQEQGHRPRPDRYRRRHRMHRVTDVGAVQHVAGPIAGPTEQGERQGHGVLESVTRPVQPREVFTHPARRLDEIPRRASRPFTMW